ncbi:PAS-domain containing protein [Parasalinivibrio latis]|uniref:PAS-domain containing protein n=1 Tax=Parasalinivibrio latis TaxID=2952610 RepID=UPI0030DF6006
MITTIRSKLTLAISTLLALTIMLTVVALTTLWENQRILDDVAGETLDDINTALSLSESVAQIAAMAPYAADAARPFQIQNEKQRLQERIDELQATTRKLHDQNVATELNRRVQAVEKAITRLLSNVERELFIREDLMAEQFALDPISNLPAGDRFFKAFSQDPVSLPDGWINEIEVLLKESQTQTKEISVVLAFLKRAQLQIRDLRAENAFYLSSVRAQSDQMADYVHSVVEQQQTALLAQKHQGQAAIKRVSAISLIIMLFIGGGALYLHKFNSRLTKDLSMVTDEMLRLARGEENVVPASIPRNDEIGILARAFSAFQRNAVEKQRITRDLREQKDLLEAIFNHMQDGLSVFDANQRLIAWNKHYLDLLNLDKTEVYIGQHIDEVQSLISRVPSHTHSLTQQPLEQTAMNQVRQTESAVFERYFEDGRIIEFRSRPMPTGGFVTLYSDLGEKKEIENQLQQAQKMENLGQLTGGIAHDFNNLLSALTGNLELMELSGNLDEKSRRYLTRALTVSEKGSHLVQRLLAFSRRQNLSPEKVELDALISEMEDLITYSTPKGIRLNFDLQSTSDRHSAQHLDSTRGMAYVDQSQLENALLNLTLNAANALAEKSRTAAPGWQGSLTISTRHCCLPQIHYDALAIEVADNGIGMSPDVKSRATEPFFSTRETGKGSGLGLSMVYGFVQQSGGDLIIDSQPGSGTTVTVILPTPPQTAPTVSEAMSPSVPGHNTNLPATLLLVEDDDDVADPLMALLTQLNVSVSRVKGADEALAVLTDFPAEYVLSDINLGSRHTGVWLYKQLALRYPDLPVTLMSGMPKETLIADFGFQTQWPLLTKPVTHPVLLQVLRSR